MIMSNPIIDQSTYCDTRDPLEAKLPPAEKEAMSYAKGIK